MNYLGFKTGSPQSTTTWTSISKLGETVPNSAPDSMGRKARLEGFLTQEGLPIWEPFVQLPIYRTEDMLEEFQNILETFGDDEEGQGMRLKLQSQELISDMMAFKAANPTAKFEDFVKW
jgi:hypothetical protein